MALSSCYRDLYATVPREIYRERERRERKREKEENSPSTRLPYDRFARDNPTSLTREQILRAPSTQRTLLRTATWGPGPGATVHVCIFRTRASARNAHTYAYAFSACRYGKPRSNEQRGSPHVAPVRPSVRPRGGAPRTPAQLILRHWLAIGGRSTGGKNEGESIADRKSEEEEQKKREEGGGERPRRKGSRREKRREKSGTSGPPETDEHAYVVYVKPPLDSVCIIEYARASTRIGTRESVPVCTYEPK